MGFYKFKRGEKRGPRGKRERERRMKREKKSGQKILEG
jgi:hypothetical protein